MADRIITRNQLYATYRGRGEFYSGIRRDQRVLLTIETTLYETDDGHEFSVTALSVQTQDGQSPHLTVRLAEVSDFAPVNDHTRVTTPNGAVVADTATKGA